MMFDSIEKLKSDWTDKYVEVDTSRPELVRFGGHVGQVRTVNMNGAALVEFDAWNNIGWYDIAVDFLKVVPKPEPKPAQAKEHSAPAAKAAAPAVAKAPTAPAAKSTADILAAARRPKGGTTEAPAAAAPTAAKPAAPAADKKLSTAEILAAARAKQAAGASAAKPQAVAPAVEKPKPAKVEVPHEPEATPAAVEQRAAAPAATAAAPQTQAATPAFAPGQRPSVSEILAWCRQHDAK